MTKDDVMIECDLSDGEFDTLYGAVLEQVVHHGVRTVSQMLTFVQWELTENKNEINAQYEQIRNFRSKVR